jgi:hypothetical protein
MKFQERIRILRHLNERELALSTHKGAAYAGEEDTLDNFKRNATRWGLTKYQVWGVYAGKHMDAIENAIKANPARPIDGTEGLIGRINDARVYLSLLACLLEEDGLLEVSAEFDIEWTGMK